MPPKPTLKDIARSAGVHISTVSLSLRGHPRIPVETRERVKAAADRLGYRMNPLVSALMQSRRSAGKVRPPALAWIGDSANSEVFAGATRRARELGFELERCSPADATAAPRAFSDRLTSRPINGLLIDHDSIDVAALALEWERFSCVTIGAPEARPRLHHVTENLFDGVLQAVARCHTQGYRRVGLVRALPPAETLLGDHALAAFALEQFHFLATTPLPPCPGLPATPTAFREWFLACEPDALLVDGAAPVLRWLRRLGRRVSGEIGLVTVSRRSDARTSGFVFDPAAAGALAIESVLGMMHRRELGLPRLPHKISLSGVWHEYDSLPARPTSDSGVLFNNARKRAS